MASEQNNGKSDTTSNNKQAAANEENEKKSEENAVLGEPNKEEKHAIWSGHSEVEARPKFKNGVEDEMEEAKGKKLPSSPAGPL